MARFLVLDWDSQELRLVWSSLNRGGVRLHHAMAIRETQGPSPAEAEALGKTLRERLKAAGMATAPVLACIGRDRVIFKEVRFPAVSPTEEPALVRFQVMKELNDPADQVVIDYTVIGELPSGERQAIALVLRREWLTAYQTLCGAAGLKLQALCPRPFGIVALPRGKHEEGAVAVVAVASPWTECCVARGDTLLLARSVPGGPGVEAEIRRSLVAYSGQGSRDPLRAVYVAGGGEAAELCDRIGAALRLPALPLDPLAGVEAAEIAPGTRGSFAGAVGLLHAWAAHGGLPINFTQPRQPRVPNAGSRRQAVAAIVGGAVLLAGAGLYGYAQLSNRDQQLSALQDEKTDLDRQLARLEEESKRLKVADDWARSGVVWLDELYDLTERFPDADSLRLVQFTGDPHTRGPKDPHVAGLTLKGMAASDYRALDGLMSRLVEDRHYAVGPKQLGRNTIGGADRFRFPQQFTAHIEVERQPAERYTARLPEPSREDGPRAGSRRGRRGQGGDGGGVGFGNLGGGSSREYPRTLPGPAGLCDRASCRRWDPDASPLFRTPGTAQQGH